MLATATDVVVVGAGPVRLTAAVVLTQRGLRATVIDDQHEDANTSRAAVVHARTLEPPQATQSRPRHRGHDPWCAKAAGLAPVRTGPSIGLHTRYRWYQSSFRH